MSYKLKLAKPTDAFYCRKTGFHLNYYKPEGVAEQLSPDIRTAVTSKRLHLLEGELTEREEAEVKTEVKKDQEEVVEEVTAEEVAEETAEEGVVDGVALEDLNKDELISFIEENGMTLEELGLTARNGEKKIREAIAKHLAE